MDSCSSKQARVSCASSRGGRLGPRVPHSSFARAGVQTGVCTSVWTSRGTHGLCSCCRSEGEDSGTKQKH